MTGFRICVKKYLFKISQVVGERSTVCQTVEIFRVKLSNR